ncbi:hypothetical protein L596_024292 [Steinernema carpocapsae]|uniref:non-specific serine/threonine protein kinase n=1 Tax=Steinernema carpocapsae TaxID=34508 RepID=A0A4U5MGB9_STECR|nr:hypothetical protein L596_024292 [Steinernema carpocapsae]
MTSSDVPAPETSAEKPSEPLHKQKSDFFFLSELGCGSFSTVHLVSERSTSRRFACKECLKKQIIRERKVDLIYREKEAMRILSASSGYAKRFFVQIYCTFQDSESLYFVMTLGTGGELRTLIRKEKQLSSEVTARYGAHIVMALDHMHKLGIIHRDLKPENILLNREDDHILLSDFGSVKIVGANESEKERLENKAEEDVAFGRRRRKNSFVGTAQYVSPEVLNNEPVSEATDFWALGCVLFQMLVGRPPFHGESEYLIFQIVLKADFTFPEDFDNTEASDLIKKLLVLEPSKRLGSKEMGGAKSVSSHPFLSKTFDDLETAIAKLGI